MSKKRKQIPKEKNKVKAIAKEPINAFGAISCVFAFLLPSLITLGTDDAMMLRDALVSLYAFGGLTWLLTSNQFRGRIVFHRFSYPIFAFIALHLIWLPFTPNAFFTIENILTVISGFMVFFLILSLEDKWREHALTAFCFGGVASILIGYIIPHFVLPPEDQTIFLDAFGNRNIFAMLLIVLIPLLAYKAHMHIKDKAWFSFYGISCLLSLYHLIFSYSRGAFVAFLVILAISVFLFSSKLIRRVGVGLGIALLLFFFLIPSLQERVMLNVDDENTSIQARIYMWEASVELIKDRPLFGLGSGLYRFFFHDKTNEKFYLIHYDKLETVTEPHNDILFFSAEVGVPGGLLYLLVFGLVLYQGFREKEKLRKKYALLGVSGLLTISLFSSVASHTAIFAMLLMVAAFTAKRELYFSISSSSKTTVNLVALPLCSILFIWCLLNSYEKFRYDAINSMFSQRVEPSRIKGELENLWDVFPSNPKQLLFWAQIYSMEGNREKNLATLQELEKCYPTAPWLDFQLGLAYLYKKEHQKSYDYMKTAFRKNPGDSKLPGILFALTTILGRVEEAKKFGEASMKNGKVPGFQVLNELRSSGLAP